MADIVIVAHPWRQIDRRMLDLGTGKLAQQMLDAIEPRLLLTACLHQAAKRRARGFTRIATIRTVIFLIAGKLDFRMRNPHAGQPT